MTDAAWRAASETGRQRRSSASPAPASPCARSPASARRPRSSASPPTRAPCASSRSAGAPRPTSSLEAGMRRGPGRAGRRARPLARRDPPGDLVAVLSGSPAYPGQATDTLRLIHITYGPPRWSVGGEDEEEPRPAGLGAVDGGRSPPQPPRPLRRSISTWSGQLVARATTAAEAHVLDPAEERQPAAVLRDRRAPRPRRPGPAPRAAARPGTTGLPGKWPANHASSPVVRQRAVTDVPGSQRSTTSTKRNGRSVGQEADQVAARERRHEHAMTADPLGRHTSSRTRHREMSKLPAGTGNHRCARLS